MLVTSPITHKTTSMLVVFTWTGWKACFTVDTLAHCQWALMVHARSRDRIPPGAMKSNELSHWISMWFTYIIRARVFSLHRLPTFCHYTTFFETFFFFKVGFRIGRHDLYSCSKQYIVLYNTLFYIIWGTKDYLWKPNFSTRIRAGQCEGKVIELRAGFLARLCKNPHITAIC